MQSFPNPIKELIEKNLKGILIELGVSNPTDQEYVLLVDENERYQYDSFDDIYRMWQTPKFIGVKLDFETVLDNLAQPQNTAPLRIKISLQNNTVILEFSQRFRKQKVIKEANQNNKYAPFVKSVENFEFTSEIERQSMIRIILFSAKNDNLFRNRVSSINTCELKEYVNWHFRNYRFYPANVSDENHKGLVLEKDFKTSLFNVFNDNSLENKIKSGLTIEKAMSFYSKSDEIKKICGLTVIE